MTEEYFGEIPLRRYVSDLGLLKDMLLLLSFHTAANADLLGIGWNRAVLRILYANGECIEWSIPVAGDRHTVFMKTAPMLYMIPRHPVKLIGLGVRSSNDGGFRQDTLFAAPDRRERAKDTDAEELALRLGIGIADLSARSEDIRWVRGTAERMRADRHRWRRKGACTLLSNGSGLQARQGAC